MGDCRGCEGLVEDACASMGELYTLNSNWSLAHVACALPHGLHCVRVWHRVRGVGKMNNENGDVVNGDVFSELRLQGVAHSDHHAHHHVHPANHRSEICPYFC